MTGDGPDYYAVLNVKIDTPPDKIKRAYRCQSKKWHPDTNDSAEAADRFMQIVEAYRTLGDRDRRAKYDESRLPPPVPPRPEFDRPRLDFGDMRAGSRSRRVMIRLYNMGGPLTPDEIIGIEPKSMTGSFWRIAGTVSPPDAAALLEFIFEADIDPSASPGTHVEMLTCSLGSQVASLDISVNVLPINDAHTYIGDSAASATGASYRSSVRTPAVAPSPAPGSARTLPSPALGTAKRRRSYVKAGAITAVIAVIVAGIVAGVVHVRSASARVLSAQMQTCDKVFTAHDFASEVMFIPSDTIYWGDPDNYTRESCVYDLTWGPNLETKATAQVACGSQATRSWADFKKTYAPVAKFGVVRGGVVSAQNLGLSLTTDAAAVTKNDEYVMVELYLGSNVGVQSNPLLGNYRAILGAILRTAYDNESKEHIC